ncbi:tyrosinase family protein [Undibacterium flavidum]|uniref:Tyrosinase family protein n=1 Tax=Undibacterium flavidum TaxID=2762297 RepID=A0ABR6YEY6_9BURK|nr:tyrosinase family protein [Undibacterium flavidum]MBC3875139.1 tyrosinase family protein [Undibacterium flavidum]
MNTSSNVQALPSQTINFSVANPTPSANLSLAKSQGAGFRSQYSTWSLTESTGFMQFNLQLSTPVRVAWSMVVCAALVDGEANNPISINVNGFSFIPDYVDQDPNFHTINWTIPPSLLNAGDNAITVTLLDSASSQFFIQSVTVAATSLTRSNAWNNDGSFQNTDLLWYAKGVGAMMSRSLDDPTSWWFFAAIHGQYIVDNDDPGTPAPSGFPNWADIPPVPAVPTSPLPSNTLIAQYWDQCQHAGWFFPPWHRGYLYALENILSIIIQQQGGPANWALPYWNYLDTNTNELNMPPAFSQTQLPDSTPNPLFVTARYGIEGNGKIYIDPTVVNQSCQQDTVYTDAYGGGDTEGFAHFGSSTGDLEQNPHNMVHVEVGGQVSQTLWGLMSDPGLAGLDPIFYLHHSNIDRLWASWNQADNVNPTDSDWLEGPNDSDPRGNRRPFYMPNPNGSAWLYYPSMVNTISQLDYSYQDLNAQTSVTAPNLMQTRLRTLSKTSTLAAPTLMQNKDTPELFGASNQKISLGTAATQVSVKLDNTPKQTLLKSLASVSANQLPDDVYLALEGIKGEMDAAIYKVIVNNIDAGHFSLFGVRKATLQTGHHAGAGLTVKLNISAIADQLHLVGDLLDSLDIKIEPQGSLQSDGETCTIDRISVYRLANK